MHEPLSFPQLTGGRYSLRHGHSSRIAGLFVLFDIHGWLALRNHTGLPVCVTLTCVDLEIRVGDTLLLLGYIENLNWAWWYRPVSPVTWEAEAGGS